MRTVVHLTASTFYGGPERQMCGLARSLPRDYRSVFVSFSERGRCQAFLEEARHQGFEAVALEHDTPHFSAAIREVEALLCRVRADVLCCHGYKSDLLGRPAARRRGVPVVAVSRGWTGANVKLRLYEMLDRMALRWMDRVVCVSEGQADKVRQAGVPPGQVLVIRNAIRMDRFSRLDPSYRDRLQAYFPTPRGRIVGAAGRLSPEKGFDILIKAAVPMVRADPALGFVLFGHGPLREKLATQIAAANLTRHFVLAGFRTDLDNFLPFLDLLVLPSYTEGLPNVVLEAFAAGVPVVATAVGGTPEVIEDGINGYLVRPGNAAILTDRIGAVLRSETERRAMGLRGQQRVRDHFSFEAQSGQYQDFFGTLAPSAVRQCSPPGGRLLPNVEAGCR
jgi:glycosyltransferase involved in cell wall biosynthesis